jgi:hypothetical protein
MTWGMRLPIEFGLFFPNGDYIGFKETLEQFFLNEMSKEERASCGGVAGYALKTSNKFHTTPEPLRPHECPREFKVEYTRVKSFGSLIHLPNRLVAVDEALKAIIERLEPGLHQFWPIRIIMPNGDIYPETYYGLRIGQRLDSFDPDASDEGVWDVSRGGIYRVYLPRKKYYEGLALSAEKIGKAHLWREAKLYKPDLYFSDELMAEIKKAGLRLPKSFRLKTV